MFAGIGGNRLYWGDKHKITAVEYNQQIASIYNKRFPNDQIYIGDAYQYFLDYFEKFDIIWASPPCQTHSVQTYANVGYRYKGVNRNIKYPDLRFYSLILFCRNMFQGNWIIENVKPYYKPLIKNNC